MRKMVVVIVVLSLVLSILVVGNSNVYGQETKLIELFIGKKDVFVGGKATSPLDVAPVITSGRTFVPLRFVSEKLGAQVKWNAKEQKVIIIQGGKTIELWPKTAKSQGKNIIRINGRQKKMDVKPYVDKKAGRTLVPVRFVSEALGYYVKWDPVGYRVSISNIPLVIKPNHSVSGNITVWYGKKAQEFIDEIVSEFEKTYNVSVKAIYVPDNVLMKKLYQAAQQGNAPDAVIADGSLLVDMIDQHLVYPIDDLIDPLVAKAYYIAPSINAFIYGERLYGLPISVDTVALIIRNDKVKQVPNTYEEFIKGDYDGDLSFPLFFKYYSPFYFATVSRGLYSYKNGYLAWNISNNVIIPFKKFANLEDIGRIAGYLGRSWNLEKARKEVIDALVDDEDGKNVVMVVGDREMYRDIVRRISYVSVLPVPGGKPLVEAYGIFLTSEKNKKATVEFMKFYTGLVSGNDGYNAAYEMAKYRTLVANVDIYLKSVIRKDKELLAFGKSASYGVCIPDAKTFEQNMTYALRMFDDGYTDGIDKLVKSRLESGVYSDMAWVSDEGGTITDFIKVDDGYIATYDDDYGTIYKVSFDGKTLWKKTFLGENDSGFIHLYAISPGNNGGFVVGGASDNGIFIAKLTSGGDLIWKKQVGVGWNNQITDIVSVGDGYIAVGNTKSIEDNSGKQFGLHDGFAIKFDENGNIVWKKLYGGNSNDVINKVIITSDGGYLLVGWTVSDDIQGYKGEGSADLFVVKVDANGNIQWQKVIGGTGDDEGYSAVETQKTYVIVGNTSSNDGDVLGHNNADNNGNDIWIVAVDKNNGNIVWQRFIGGSSEDKAYDAVLLPTGNIVVLGDMGEDSVKEMFGIGFGGSDIVLATISTSGDIKKVVPLGGDGDDTGYHMLYEGSYTYTIVGDTYSNPVYDFSMASDRPGVGGFIMRVHQR